MKKVLSTFSLVMINLVAVDSIRSLPISAEYGFSILFFYILAGAFFLIPTALVAGELSTAWPKTGGIYIWLREAFGQQWGFMIVWLQWLYNIIWYPTIMSLLAATIAYIFSPILAENKTYMFLMILGLFWCATFANWFGMRMSSWVSTVSSIVGTLIPMAFIVVLAILWLAKGNPSQIHFTASQFFPQFNHIDNFALLTMVLFGLIGMEMSAIHAGDVKNPQRDYPRALFFSAVIILLSLATASLAIAVVVPHSSIELASGLMQGFSLFFSAFHLSWMTIIIAVLVIIGGFGSVSAWVIGPSKALMVAAEDGAAPTFFAAKNAYAVPSRILIAQGIVTSILSFLFIFMPSINSAFTLLSAMTGQVALLVYVAMFAAAIKLRYSKPDVKRVYRIPGGNVGMWLVAGAGIITSMVVFIVGFFPPSQIPLGNIVVYEGLLIGGVVLICVLPFLFRFWSGRMN